MKSFNTIFTRYVGCGKVGHFLGQLIKRQSCHHIDTSQMIYKANQLAGFQTMPTLAFNESINYNLKNINVKFKFCMIIPWSLLLKQQQVH